MSQPVSAAIHIQASTIRCAEIVEGDSTLDLRRFGHRSFEFDITRVLWEGGETESPLDRVQAAVGEELEGTEASRAHVVLHPLDAFSFFTPISAALSERDRMHHVIQQAALLTGTRSPDSLRITPRTVRTADYGDGELIEWVHVLVVPKAVKEQIETLLESIPVEDHVLIVSSEAAARLVGYTKKQEAAPAGTGPAPYSLAVGEYRTHTEFALTYDQVWHHALATQESARPENRAYYALGFLNRLDVSLEDVGRLFVYGADPDRGAYDVFESLLECEPERLDPFQVLPRSPGRPRNEESGAYAPCVGGALEIGE